MKCLIIDSVSPEIAQEPGKYMQVDTRMLPTHTELLEVIGVCSVGLNHVDLDAAKANGVQVFNAPGLNGNAVAELTISKMLELARAFKMGVVAYDNIGAYIIGKVKETLELK